jgi:LysM repeat protein
LIAARLLSVLLLVAILPCAAPAAEGEDPPRIYFEKKVYSDMAGGKQNFFETHTVEKGETLWKILERKEHLTPDRYAERLTEFRRANPEIADPSRLAPGQKLLVPSGGRREMKDDGRTVVYTVKRGDSLSKILSSHRVPRGQRKKYLAAIREANASIRDVNRIFAGKNLRIPTAGYFAETKPEPLATAPEPAPPSKPAVPSIPPAPENLAATAPEPAPPSKPAVPAVPPAPENLAVAAPEPAPPSKPAVPAVPPAPENLAVAAPEPAPPSKPAVPSIPPAPENLAVAAPVIAPVPPPANPRSAPEVSAAPPLTRDIPPVPGQGALAAGKPEAELLPPTPVSPTASIVETGKAKAGGPVVIPPSGTPYRGLLSDLFLAIGEKWVDRGTMYFPLPSGGDVTLQLSDFPVVRFSGGTEALVDFRGGIPPRIADAIAAEWKSLRVVSLADAGGAGDRIDRILRVSGYHSVKEGIHRPIVMGETVSVALPARWVIQRTEDSLLSGDLVLLKEVPEKPGPELLAVLRYARRLGLRVLPYADDPKAMEGFLVGVGEDLSPDRLPVALEVPKAGGLPTVDFGLSLLGIASKTGERLRVGGEGDAFRLVVSPERLFEAGGRKYVVDAGKMSPAIRSILRESGYAVFPAEKGISGREILRRIMKAAGIGSEERKEVLVAGGETSGYEVRVTGTFLSLPGPPGGSGRTVVLVGRKMHSATRALLGDIGVEIVEW